MRKFTRSAVSLLLVLVLCACGAGSQWQEQYDLGTRYLNDGNYEEAVIAFTAAIEIDPKRPEAYVGAATAYTALGERQLAIEMLDKAEALLGENDTITAARDELGAEDARTVKSMTRAGMGWCQGRMCAAGVECLVRSRDARSADAPLRVAASERLIANPVPLRALVAESDA